MTGIIKIAYSRLGYYIKDNSMIEFYIFDEYNDHYYVGRASKYIDDNEFQFIKCELTKEDVDIIFIYVDSFKNNTL